jgi:hypothetical protein
MSLSELNENGLGKVISLEKYGLSTFALKIIAVITMFIDHFALVFCSDYRQLYEILRSIGRLSFPIFCFVLVEGFFHTSDRLRYAIRLGIFALVSEIPYNMLYGSFFNLSRQNVIFTLFFGFLTIGALDFISAFRVNYPKNLLRHIGAGRLNTISELIVIVAGLGVPYLLKTSYSYAGVMLILCFYVFEKHHIGRFISNLVFNMGMFGFSLQWWGVVSTIPIALYNGKAGSKKGKYFFYWFYPLHLIFLVALRCIRNKYL